MAFETPANSDTHVEAEFGDMILSCGIMILPLHYSLIFLLS
jgi:hypothetical protein